VKAGRSGCTGTKPAFPTAWLWRRARCWFIRRRSGSSASCAELGPPGQPTQLMSGGKPLAVAYRLAPAINLPLTIVEQSRAGDAGRFDFRRQGLASDETSRI